MYDVETKNEFHSLEDIELKIITLQEKVRILNKDIKLLQFVKEDYLNKPDGKGLINKEEITSKKESNE